LVNLATKYYSNPFNSELSHDVTLNSLLIALASPNASFAWTPYRTSGIKEGLSPERLLNKGTTLNSMIELYHVPALKQYVNFLLELIPYYDIIRPKSFWDRTLEIVPPSVAYNSVKGTPNPEIVRMLRNALHFINIAIAQQALMSGDQLISLIDRSLDFNKPENHDLVVALSKGFTLGSNFSTYVVKSALKFTRDSYKGIMYDENFNENLKLYKEYFESDYKDCSFNFDKNQYEEKCHSKFATSMFGKYKLSGRMIVFKSGTEVYPVPLPSPDSLAKSKFYYTSQLYELQELKEQVLEKVLMNRGAYDQVVSNLGFF